MRKILIVEDETVLRETYQIILSSQPYDVFVASNGQEALDICEKQEFDLILLDLMMPIMNGVEFIETFDTSSHPKTRIIVLSNLSTGDMLKQATELGAYKNAIKSELSPRQLVSLVQYEMEAT